MPCLLSLLFFSVSVLGVYFNWQLNSVPRALGENLTSFNFILSYEGDYNFEVISYLNSTQGINLGKTVTPLPRGTGTFTITMNVSLVSFNTSSMSFHFQLGGMQSNATNIVDDFLFVPSYLPPIRIMPQANYIVPSAMCDINCKYCQSPVLDGLSAILDISNTTNITTWYEISPTSPRCVICNSPYVVNSTYGCMPGLPGTGCFIHSCRVCETTTVCSECEPGYYKFNNLCFSLSCDPALNCHCMDTNVCGICYDGYQLADEFNSTRCVPSTGHPGEGCLAGMITNITNSTTSIEIFNCTQCQDLHASIQGDYCTCNVGYYDADPCPSTLNCVGGSAPPPPSGGHDSGFVTGVSVGTFFVGVGLSMLTVCVGQRKRKKDVSSFFQRPQPAQKLLASSPDKTTTPLVSTSTTRHQPSSLDSSASSQRYSGGSIQIGMPPLPSQDRPTRKRDERKDTIAESIEDPVKDLDLGFLEQPGPLFPDYFVAKQVESTSSFPSITSPLPPLSPQPPSPREHKDGFLIQPFSPTTELLYPQQEDADSILPRVSSSGDIDYAQFVSSPRTPLSTSPESGESSVDEKTSPGSHGYLPQTPVVPSPGPILPEHSPLSLPSNFFAPSLPSIPDSPSIPTSFPTRTIPTSFPHQSVSIAPSFGQPAPTRRYSSPNVTAGYSAIPPAGSQAPTSPPIVGVPQQFLEIILNALSAQREQIIRLQKAQGDSSASLPEVPDLSDLSKFLTPTPAPSQGHEVKVHSPLTQPLLSPDVRSYIQPQYQHLLQSQAVLTSQIPLPTKYIPPPTLAATALHPQLMKPPQMPLPPSDKSHVCPYPGCGAFFGTRYNLKRHIKKHTGEKPFQCNWTDGSTVCDKKFAEKATLQRHMRSHTGEKPFKCQLCGKVFADRVNWNRHKQTHASLQSQET